MLCELLILFCVWHRIWAEECTEKTLQEEWDSSTFQSVCEWVGIQAVPAMVNKPGRKGPVLAAWFFGKVQSYCSVCSLWLLRNPQSPLCHEWKSGFVSGAPGNLSVCWLCLPCESGLGWGLRFDIKRKFFTGGEFLGPGVGCPGRCVHWMWHSGPGFRGWGDVGSQVVLDDPKGLSWPG